MTTWGVYPIGYLLPVLAPSLDPNWINVAFTVADMVNKIGVGVVIYLAAAKVLEERVPKFATEPAHEVG